MLLSRVQSDPADHPRSRGGNSASQEQQKYFQGPSPLARGKPFAAEVLNVAQGTIPARAGETCAPAPPPSCSGDHPRSRGGNWAMLPGVERSRGPSPLARGKQRRHSTWPTLTGTIPARAGETKRRKRGKVGSRDHPRSRGGNLCKRSFLFLGGGPSPLARGKHTPCTCRPCNQGTIPARAGETISDSARYSPLRDHPRSRGGNVALSRDGAQVWGPSPLARGKLRGADQLARPAGTIPARAGETLRCCSGQRHAWDHPRSRGGNPR